MTRKSQHRSIRSNRAPVFTLWAAVVAERLGFDWEEALTVGRAVAGLNAYSKGVSIGLFQPSPKVVREQRRKLSPAETFTDDLLHRAVPAVHTEQGVRVLEKKRPSNPANVQRYLDGKFRDALEDVYEAMKALARAYPPGTLAREAYHLYERFRPAVPAGQRGWGASGTLDIDAIRHMATRGD